MLFFESAQTHTGVDDSDFTCWLLQAFVEALIRRRDREHEIKFYQPPSREWDRGDGPAPKRRRSCPLRGCRRIRSRRWALRRSGGASLWEGAADSSARGSRVSGL